MAILEAQQAEVVVLIDGRPAREYDNDDDTEIDSENKVTKYIEVVSGKEFSFRITLRRQFAWRKADTIVCKPTIDGKKYSALCMELQSFNRGTGQQGSIRGEWSGFGSDGHLFKYVFNDIETRSYLTDPYPFPKLICAGDIQRTDDPSQMKALYSDLGLLSITLWRERAITYQEGTSTFAADDLKPIPEKALKGRPLDVATSYAVGYHTVLPLT